MNTYVHLLYFGCVKVNINTKLGKLSFKYIDKFVYLNACLLSNIQLYITTKLYTFVDLSIKDIIKYIQTGNLHKQLMPTSENSENKCQKKTVILLNMLATLKVNIPYLQLSYNTR